jgi:hypothetical protein
MDGTAAKISAAHHIWEEDVQTYRTCTSVQQALKKQIISVFEPMYWISSSRLTATSLQPTSRSILNTCAELGIPNSQWRLSSSRFKTVSTILKRGGILIGHPQQINIGYAKIFATGHFMSACRRWNEKPTA